MITTEEFKKEVWRLAYKVGVEPKEIHIRKMKNKWASCSAKGRLTFDSSILSESTETRFEIIIHELLHLKYPNHGKMFKRLLDAYLRNEIDIMMK
ncbi:M48 metallopeptidase family protein [Methanobacterium congolense]|uniref:YgjP-like metallopeptidase domain-containing protein n=1 Tax=Methanobacterium congolense TaxID=118062 RepID=A0A1D3L2X8_9EURY|nr:M48 family metallopeptidase [Methanobacterium congolense]SCG85971.1 putative protein [Methanobacterium congolense]